MRTYVTVLAGRTAREMRPIVSSADPLVIEATLNAIREQAVRESTATATERARAREAVESMTQPLLNTRK